MLRLVFDNNKMDNGHNNNSSRMEGSMMLRLQENESARNPDDILVRRLKNRERQRRYRARKRHEADLRNASTATADHSIPLHHQHIPAEFVSVPVEVEVFKTVTPTDHVARVHCPRDWKKDARRAHMLKKQEASTVACNHFKTAAASGGNSATLLESVANSDILALTHSYTCSLDNNATQKLQSNRRHWKAEARNRRSSQ